MADLSTEIELVFIEAPKKDINDPDYKWSSPRVMVDISGVEPIIQPLMLRILQLVYEKSIERGAEYYFPVR